MRGLLGRQRSRATIVASCVPAACVGLMSNGLRPWEHAVPLGVMESPGIATGQRSTEMISLGRELFFDQRLSKDGSLSCASCHVPENAFAEPHAVSHGIGADARRRNTPTVLNSGLQRALDWDGRATSLEAQLYGVFARSGDFGIELSDAVAILRQNSRYRSLFLRTFGKGPDVDGLTRALSAFQRSLLAGNSRFDRFFFGGDSSALTLAERRGWGLFSSSRAGCSGCHAILFPDPRGRGVALFTDQRFHNLGIGYENGRMMDVGRYEATGEPDDWGAFKTPGLRNVALTAPYMHDGSIATLDDVVELYARGGVPNPRLDPVMRPRSLSDVDKADLVAFLKALSTEDLAAQAAVAPPARPRNKQL